MDKSAIKTFAIWARNKLIADISYKAGLLGITDKEIHIFIDIYGLQDELTPEVEESGVKTGGL
jgi:hypothetical protein